MMYVQHEDVSDWNYSKSRAPKLPQCSQTASPEAPDKANNAENWQHLLWLNCKPVGFKDSNKSYTKHECYCLLRILRYMHGSSNLFNCSS